MRISDWSSDVCSSDLQVGAGLRQLVEHQRSASELGEDGEQAGPGRGLQHTVGRRDRGGGAGRKSKGDRRRELLKRLALRSEEHTSELQSLMRISYAVFCLKKKNIYRNE